MSTSQLSLVIIQKRAYDSSGPPTAGIWGHPRPRRQWIYDIEEWTGCEYMIQLKEMSQDRAQWRRKILEWSSTVANPHRGRSTCRLVSEWVSHTVVKVPLVTGRNMERSFCTPVSEIQRSHTSTFIKTLWPITTICWCQTYADVQFPHFWFSTLTTFK